MILYIVIESWCVMIDWSDRIRFRDEALKEAIYQGNSGVVALETAVLTHGLPYPYNIQCMHDMKAAVIGAGATPVPIGLLDGYLVIGLSDEEIEQLGTKDTTGADKSVVKVSVRDFASVLAAGDIAGGTTVAATLLACKLSGIRVFATGGIGGVHRGWKTSLDISADLDQLAQTKCAVVSSGAKAILDIPATLEAIESRGIPIVGYHTDHFPEFYATSQNPQQIRWQCDDVYHIAKICKFHWDILELQSAVLVANPIPADAALDGAMIGTVIEEALLQAEKAGITGAAVTPYLLEMVANATHNDAHGSALKANLVLLENNARVAGELACALADIG